MRLKLTLAALAATAAFASPAVAQVVIPPASDVGTARGTVLRPLSVSEDENLDFGTILVDGSAAGWVEVDAEDGSRSVDGGGGVQLVALQPGGRGVFTVTASQGQQVDLTLTPPVGNVLIHVDGSGAQVDISQFRLDNVAGPLGLTDSRITCNSGAHVVGVGARFEIDATQPHGVYSATYQLTAEYN